jgi:hypothetical protein
MRLDANLPVEVPEAKPGPDVRITATGAATTSEREKWDDFNKRWELERRNKNKERPVKIIFGIVGFVLFAFVVWAFHHPKILAVLCFSLVRI